MKWVWMWTLFLYIYSWYNYENIEETIGKSEEYSEVYQSSGRRNLISIHSSQDADFNIMKLAFNVATSKPVSVVGDDTDLIVLLLHHYSQDDLKDVYMQLANMHINTIVLQKRQLDKPWYTISYSSMNRLCVIWQLDHTALEKALPSNCTYQ